MSNAVVLPGALAASTEPVFALGTLFNFDHPTYGWQTYRYIYNDEASTAFAVGDVVVQDIAGGTNAYDGLLPAAAAPAVKVLGIAQAACAAGSYIGVLINGKGLARAGDNAADQSGDSLVTGGATTPSGVDVMGAGAEAEVIAYGLQNAAATTGVTFLVSVRVP